jgi:hypothetical protein
MSAPVPAMHLAFHVTSVPEDPTGYRAVAYTEGELRVRIGTREFVRFEALTCLGSLDQQLLGSAPSRI